MSGDSTRRLPRLRRWRRNGETQSIAAAEPADEPAVAASHALPPHPRPSFELARCELVSASDDGALLRVSGRWQPATPTGVELLRFGNGSFERTKPLPPGQAEDGDGVWLAAFAVDPAALDLHLALMTPAGPAAELPKPQRVDAAAASVPASQIERRVAREREARAAAEARADEAEQRAHEAERKTAELAGTEHDLRQKLDSLTRTDIGEPAGRRPRIARRGGRVSARAYREALAELEAERAERARLEDEAARLADQVRQLEIQLAEEMHNAAVETDLRHLLESRQRELESARAELSEQRARFAALASQPAAAADEDRSPEPWSLVDEDLLARIARAKQMAGQD